MISGVVERTGEQIADSTKKAAELLKEGIGTAKRVARQGSEMAEDLYESSTKRVRRHPARSILTTFVVAFCTGYVLARLITRE